MVFGWIEKVELYSQRGLEIFVKKDGRWSITSFMGTWPATMNVGNNEDLWSMIDSIIDEIIRRW